MSKKMSVDHQRFKRKLKEAAERAQGKPEWVRRKLLKVIEAADAKHLRETEILYTVRGK